MHYPDGDTSVKQAACEKRRSWVSCASRNCWLPKSGFVLIILLPSPTGAWRDACQVNRSPRHKLFLGHLATCYIFFSISSIKSSLVISWLYRAHILAISQPGSNFADPRWTLRLYFGGSPRHLESSLQLDCV